MTTLADQVPSEHSSRDEEDDIKLPMSESPTREGHEDEGVNASDLTKSISNRSIAETLPLGKEILFVGTICCAQFMTQGGLGQCLDILQVIGDDFGLTNPGELSWLIAAYSLTVGTFILLAGRFGDVYGYKKMFIIGFSWFSLWSMIAGLAVYSNHVLFNFARAFQGMGPAICLPNALAILGSVYPPGPRKAMVFALFGATAPGGAVIGSLFAGLFSELAWWPWTFWSFSIALAGLAALGSIVIPSPPRKVVKQKWSLRDHLIQLDLLGGLCGVTALVLINFAWNQAGVVGWSKAYVYVCLILGFVIVPVFFFIEVRVSPAPLIPFKALTSDVAFVLGCVACGWSCFGIWVFYLWQFFQILRQDSPLLAVAHICPVAITGALASVTTGILLGRLRPAWVMMIALTAFTVGTILTATAPIGQIYWAQTFVCTMIIPWGMDMSFPAATLILSNAVSKEHQGVAASLVNTVVNYSISLSLGFAGTIESHVDGGGKTPADVLRGYRGAWYMAIGLTGFGLFLSVLFVIKGYWRDRRVQSQNEQDEKPSK